MQGYVYIREKTILRTIIEKDVKDKSECKFMLGHDGHIKSMEGFAFPKGSPYKPLFDSLWVVFFIYTVLCYYELVTKFSTGEFLRYFSHALLHFLSKNMGRAID